MRTRVPAWPASAFRARPGGGAGDRPSAWHPGQQAAAVAAGRGRRRRLRSRGADVDHLRSEEHTSELQSLMRISYAVFCLKKKSTTKTHKQVIHTHTQ